MKKVLVLEDEENIRSFVVINLKRAGYEAVEAGTGEEALERLKQNPDIKVALLDIMLPDIDGFEVCRRIRATNNNIGIIMLTARTQEMDKVTGLMTGADDYMTKPFQPLELVARVKAQLRRYKRYNVQQKAQELSYLGLVMNRDLHICRLNEKDVSLTPIEFRILWYLCERQGKVVSAKELYTAIWQEEYLTSSNNTLMVHIRHIREKMHDRGEHPRYIQNVWGVGYKLGDSL